MDAHHLFNRPGGGVYRLSPVSPDGRVTPVVDSLGEGIPRSGPGLGRGRRFRSPSGTDRTVGRASRAITFLRRESTARACASSPPDQKRLRAFLSAQWADRFHVGPLRALCDVRRRPPFSDVVRHGARRFAGASAQLQRLQRLQSVRDARRPDPLQPLGIQRTSVTSLHHPFTMNPDERWFRPTTAMPPSVPMW